MINIVVVISIYINYVIAKSVTEENFFSSWGLENTREGGSAPELSAAVASASQTTGMKKLATSTSLWGSFTGSFFDNPKDSLQEGSNC